MALDYAKYWIDLGLQPSQGIPEPPAKGKINPEAWRDYTRSLSEFKTRMNAYLDNLIAKSMQQADLMDQFYVDLVKEYKISSNPKAAPLIRLVISQQKGGATLEEIEKGVAQLCELIIPLQSG